MTLDETLQGQEQTSVKSVEYTLIITVHTVVGLISEVDLLQTHTPMTVLVNPL